MQSVQQTEPIPARIGRGRPRTEKGDLCRQRVERAKAKKEAKALLTPEVRQEEYRRKRKEWDAARYVRDGDKVRDGAKRSYRKHFAKRAVTTAERYRRFSQQGMLYRAEKRSAERGFDFDLTIDDIVIPTHCPVLGMPIQIRDGNKAGPLDNSPTLDRIDNSKGYIKGNVCVISWRANRIKGDASLAEMESIVAYMRGKP